MATVHFQLARCSIAIDSSSGIKSHLVKSGLSSEACFYEETCSIVPANPVYIAKSRVVDHRLRGAIG
ncbi:hypothetical protein PGT21_026717 [Puccinia graminis f. sp. tritici]|uniref:Uncharacterized protein n=1 Tax=Puccinia graminis f. sp. tritici TaxID=56615 RepID=A0A5B0QIX0_PUCGR|nr:hypothetical protein PGT21_026717 [Puccinia graminis f. sp. tritici]